MDRDEKMADARIRAEAELKTRTERFLDELQIRHSSFKKLYENGHTHEVVKTFGISYGAFYKLIERMPGGGGLYNNPILLRAVLHDAGYPANYLFETEDEKPLKAELVLGPGTADEVRRIVSEAVRNSYIKPMRQLGIKRRINAAFVVLTITQILRKNENYANAICILFFSYSKSNLASYPHGRIKSIDAIDNLIRFHFLNWSSEQYTLLGSVLVLAYLLFEIARITYSLLTYTEKSKNKQEELQPEILGFVFDNENTKRNIRSKIVSIEDTFSSVITNITNRNEFPNFVIPSHSINFAIELLAKLLSFEYKYPNNFFTINGDTINMFKYFVDLPTDVTFHSYINVTDELLLLYNKIFNCLTDFNDDLTGGSIVLPPPVKS
ncbi:hypothetical protein [Treponema primitia]|uniref:hypothetical protein n=1 Tax=Treponema primitia TaxID=88058 RepID=UPI0002554E40|nr:hypothetical protein [Treponema primitia]